MKNALGASREIITSEKKRENNRIPNCLFWRGRGVVFRNIPEVFFLYALREFNDAASKYALPKSASPPTKYVERVDRSVARGRSADFSPSQHLVMSDHLMRGPRTSPEKSAV